MQQENNCQMLDFSNYILQYACDKNEPITGLKLQKALYFTFIDGFQSKDVTLHRRLTEIYDQPFFVWRYGPVCHFVYEQYSKYGSIPILDSTPPLYDYSEFNQILDELLNQNILSLVTQSQNTNFWKTSWGKHNHEGRTNVPYTIKQLKGESI